jgi:hypothetical protein
VGAVPGTTRTAFGELYATTAAPAVFAPGGEQAVRSPLPLSDVQRDMLRRAQRADGRRVGRARQWQEPCGRGDRCRRGRPRQRSRRRHATPPSPTCCTASRVPIPCCSDPVGAAATSPPTSPTVRRPSRGPPWPTPSPPTSGRGNGWPRSNATSWTCCPSRRRPPRCPGANRCCRRCHGWRPASSRPTPTSMSAPRA